MARDVGRCLDPVDDGRDRLHLLAKHLLPLLQCRQSLGQRRLLAADFADGLLRRRLVCREPPLRLLDAIEDAQGGVGDGLDHDVMPLGLRRFEAGEIANDGAEFSRQAFLDLFDIRTGGSEFGF
ncbi:MAG TPA: hypothetical protein VFQ80_11360, partial [Thermomicrobiales bacterium]|nr:hypothetical protein [Thermomicrobiales bacterium]